MKTSRLLMLAFIATGLIAVSCSQGGTASEKETKASDKAQPTITGVTIDTDKSRVVWAGTMLGIYTHEGTIDLTKADLKVEDGKITGGSFTIDMNTMVATDENYNPEQGSTPEKLIGHLKSDDFFAVEQFPTATFKITSVQDNSLKGMLTVRGKTSEETVENIEMKQAGDKVKIKGEMTFDRKKYDVSWDSSVKERVLSNDIKLKIELSGK